MKCTEKQNVVKSTSSYSLEILATIFVFMGFLNMHYAVVIVNLFLDLLGYENWPIASYKYQHHNPQHGVISEVTDTDFTFIDKSAIAAL